MPFLIPYVFMQIWLQMLSGKGVEGNSDKGLEND